LSNLLTAANSRFVEPNPNETLLFLSAKEYSAGPGPSFEDIFGRKDPPKVEADFGLGLCFLSAIPSSL
jgi:hypothetical protein